MLKKLNVTTKPRGNPQVSAKTSEKSHNKKVKEDR
jgi:hypothetical protein